MSAEEDVRKVSKQFYSGLNRMANGGDTSLIAEVWAHNDNVTAMHPINGRNVGWKEISKSFDQVSDLASDGMVDLKDQLIRVVGDVAYELGTEYGEFKLAGQKCTIEHRVTNIYHKQGGMWKMIHHHADNSPAMIEIISQLQPVMEKAGR
jgi:ketosteroid isomerase-like protein